MTATTYARAEGSATAEVDGETVVLSPSDLRYHSLNATASALWAHLEQPRTVTQLVEAMLEEFDVDPDTCRADVEAGLDQLAAIGLVTTA